MQRKSLGKFDLLGIIRTVITVIEKIQGNIWDVNQNKLNIFELWHFLKFFGYFFGDLVSWKEVSKTDFGICIYTLFEWNLGFSDHCATSTIFSDFFLFLPPLNCRRLLYTSLYNPTPNIDLFKTSGLFLVSCVYFWI